jgi:hypothetical protein
VYMEQTFDNRLVSGVWKSNPCACLARVGVLNIVLGVRLRKSPWLMMAGQLFLVLKQVV